MYKYTVIITICLAICSCKQRVDTIIYSKKLYTSDSIFSIAQAAAIKDGKIVAIATNESIEEEYTSDNIIDYRDAYVYAGFIDAHCHFSAYALDGYKCDLVGTASFQEVLGKVTEYEKTNNLSWIYGRGWDQNEWQEKTFPDKTELDKLFPNKPVILKRIDGHAVLCNQKAIDMAGININTHIDGGIIEKKNGQLTGILIDNATAPVEKLIKQLPEKLAIEYLQQTEKECFSYGLTGVVDCGVKHKTIDLLLSLYGKNKLQIANSILLDQEQETLDAFANRGLYKRGQIQINGIKLYADGALGSRGACLLSPYSDMPTHYGMMLTDITKMKEIAALAKANELQLCTHAIGDSANRAILRLYSQFLSKSNDKRWRVEHAQVVDYQDYTMFSEYNIVPSVQPTHATSDMPWAQERLGEKRIYTAYAYKNLLDLNRWIALGTDFPVEQINPLGTFYAAVVRKDKNGFPDNGFEPDNKLSRKEALLGMTSWAAKSVFWEKERGSIEIGKNADFVILDKDIMTVTEKEILNTSVLQTIVNGKTVYNKSGD